MLNTQDRQEILGEAPIAEEINTPELAALEANRQIIESSQGFTRLVLISPGGRLTDGIEAIDETNRAMLDVLYGQVGADIESSRAEDKSSYPDTTTRVLIPVPSKDITFVETHTVEGSWQSFTVRIFKTTDVYTEPYNYAMHNPEIDIIPLALAVAKVDPRSKRLLKYILGRRNTQYPTGRHISNSLMRYMTTTEDI